MKKLTLLIFSFVLILLYACNNKHKTNTKDTDNIGLKCINIDVNTIKPIRLKNIFKSLSYTRLETRKNSLIGVITKIIIYKNRIYISDNNNKIFIFSKTGKLINSIYENGRGPGEYVFFRDFAIDKINAELILTEQGLLKFLYYDLNGVFHKEEQFKERFSRFFVKNNFIYLFADNTTNIGNSISVNDNLIITSKDLKYYSSFFPIPKSKMDYGLYGIQPFSEFDNKLSLLMPYTDTVIFISPDTVSPRYYFDYGKNKVPYDVFKSVETNIPGRMRVIINKLNKMLENGYAYSSKNFLETYSTIFFKFSYRGIQSVFYSKTSETIYISKNFINDIDHIPYKPPIAATDSEFVSVLEPADIIEHYKKIKNKYPANELNTIKQLVDSITEFDNPILVFAKTKPF